MKQKEGSNGKMKKADAMKNAKVTVILALLLGGLLVFTAVLAVVGHPSQLGKSEPKMTLELASSRIETGKTMHAIGSLIGSSEIAGATVGLQVKLPDGSMVFPLQGASTTTDNAGTFTMDYRATSPGTYRLTATFEGSDQYAESSADDECNVAAADSIAKNTTIVLIRSASSVEVGKNMHVDGQLTSGAGVANSIVNLQVNMPDGSSVNPEQGSSVTTDTEGKFSIDYIPATEGSYKYVASFVGNKIYNSSSATAPFTVEEKPGKVCDKPWPSRIDMIQAPQTMVAGETYTFKAQMYVQNYDTNCILSPWYYATDTPITWTFTNSNGISVTKESTTSSPDGIASVEFPCYMAGDWSVTAHWAGNANYIETDGHSKSTATGNTVYWNGFWVTVEKWYKTADPAKYPTDFGWQIGPGYDPAFVLLKVRNAQSVINTNTYFYNLYLTDTDRQAYSGMSGRFIGTNQFTSGLAPGAEAEVWVCFWIPNSQSLVINGMYGVVGNSYYWGYQDYGYLGPTTYNVNFPLPAESLP